MAKKRIGVFVCHCGINIAGVVDVERVAREVMEDPDVVYAKNYLYMCSDPGQEMVRKTIEDEKLDGIVVVACSPRLHEPTFRKAAQAAGLNPYQSEMANIREHCSWVHEHEPELATEKAIDTARTMIRKVKGNMALDEIRVDITRRAMVIGGGVAGMQAAIDIANSGYPVFLVEKDGQLGGHVRQLYQTFPYGESAAGLIRPLLAQVKYHPNITVLTRSEVEEVTGYVGNFEVKIRTRAAEEGGEDEIREEKIGGVVLATGFDLYSKADVSEYGGGSIPDVITSMELEAILNPDGPTGGELRRPSDGSVPKEVVFIQCVRSRDQEHGVPYCSKICCMYTAKHARIVSQQVPDGQAYVFYMDIRAAGKTYEEYVQGATGEDNVLYLRGRVSRVFQSGDKVVVHGADTLSGRNVEIEADLVVLAMAIVPDPAGVALAKELKLSTDEFGFVNEAHPKLRPVETPTAGFYLAGCCQAPKDLPETIAQASGAAVKVISIFAGDYLTHEPIVVEVDEDLCSGCGLCVEACPYGARKIVSRTGKAKIIPVLCHGCGSCAVACPNGASQQRNFTSRQYMDMVDTVT